MKNITNYIRYIFASILASCLFTACSSDNDGSFSSDSYSAGGSMARFSISGDHLYTVDHNTLKTFDISNTKDPKYLDKRDQQLGNNIETIFTRDTLLFIGSQDGMYIFNITRPAYPQQMSITEHIRACDPVVANGDYAYVTLNSESVWCGSTSNLLDVYDISKPEKPVVIYTDRNVTAPKGLGIDRNFLFVCDGQSGIKVYDVTNPAQPKWKSDLNDIPQMSGTKTYDVIPVKGNLIVTASDGIYQLDYSHWKPNDATWEFKFISKMAITNE